MQPPEEKPNINVITADGDQTPAIDGQVSNVDKKPEEKGPVPPTPPNQNVKFAVAPKKVLRIYIVPIGSIIIFFLILGLLVIPGVNKLFSTLDMVGLTNEESSVADEMLVQLQSLASRQNELQSDLDVIRNLAPAGTTQVAAFQRKIIDLAENQNLSVTEATLEETILSVEGDDVTASLGLIEIPSRFTIQGTLGQLRDFVGTIQSLNDFVIIGEMTLRTNQIVNITNFNDISEDDWILALTLVKYQFQIPDEQNQLEDFYQNVPPTVELEQDVIDFASQREAIVQETIIEESSDTL